ncbi:MAG: hypothetical protein CMI53_00070 [Parcubacteria group bacterium]|nr:hypothetical protein [Parcubacteria group bacterium]|tara:strand:- start:11179 stop:12336 length:1158 start_codon:yes stop_codon:yes gene_type:complete
MKKSNIAIILIIVIIIIGFWLFNRFGDDFNLPSGRETTTETIVISNGQVIGTADELGQTSDDNSDYEPTGTIQDDNPAQPKNPIAVNDDLTNIQTKEIMITDGVKHSIPLDKIVGGGPPKDGIPSIDNPKFTTVSEASDEFADEDPGIAVSLNGIDRFYPFQILVWHEIVNDTFDDQRVLVTYCPLCLSGIVFDPVVNGQRVEFGTSGKLWNSNLVMYDRKTDSLWSQILGEAVVGELTGTQLKILESDQMRFGEWKRLNPNGQVLSKDTGATRFYGRDPYGDYYTSPGVFFNVDNRDDRLPEKAFVLGIVIGEEAKAYLPEAVKKVGTLEDKFAGKTIIAEYKSDIDTVQLFEKRSDGTRERINPFPNFWFSWVAVHPDTELYK